MKKFILKVLLFFIPVYLLAGLYFLIDPFKVLYHYDEPVNTNKNYQVATNRDYESTELFINQYEKEHYNSFILGNSRSFFYQADTLSKLTGGKFFHLNASNETLWGISKKLQFLDKKKVDIKNILIVIDHTALAKISNSKGHLYIKHPATSGESAFAFQVEMFNGFCSKALYAYTDLYFTGTYKPYMSAYGIGKHVWQHNKQNNQLSYFVYDKQIADNADAYYTEKKNFFYKRDTALHTSKRIIYGEQQHLLKEIAGILKAHHTNYKIVISPLYDQLKLNPSDLKQLQDLFGSNNVYDFSGINDITSDYRNYYEASHYRPPVCNKIVNLIYQ